MSKTMGREARQELVEVLRPQYQAGSWVEKVKILDGAVAATGYDRKYLIRLLGKPLADVIKTAEKKQPVPRKYDERVRQALLSVWYAANQICSKRLVPFLADFVDSLERHGHLSLPVDVREKLLSISPATVDRLLRSERERIGKATTTTKPGNLLKHQIRVRTFADWDDVVPGFLEGDTVAHCGGDSSGQFLNTLVLVDIATGWVELIPLLRKSASDVIAGLEIVQELLPFPILGLDFDNGLEFINYEVLNYCEDNKITFTRARRHRKNDQAHVEEKNGSIVRRLVGYDRFEGREAWLAMSELYRHLRQYINFFQPSMKLASKVRKGARVSKKYDVAKTPLQRILLDDGISEDIKQELERQYFGLDPLWLMERMEHTQHALFEFGFMQLEPKRVTVPDIVEISENANVTLPELPKMHHFSGAGKLDGRSRPGKRTWRTREDPFKNVWSGLKFKLELNPEQTAKSLLEELVKKAPDQFNMSQLRTLQRRVAEWREQQTIYELQLKRMLVPEENGQSQTLENEIASLLMNENV
jgi:hypothetical protein